MKPNPLQERVGTAEISRTEPVVAGSFVDFTITYTAGYFGIDDTGSVKICTRFATDMGRPQFTAPAQPNYVSIVARRNRGRTRIILTCRAGRAAGVRGKTGGSSGPSGPSGGVAWKQWPAGQRDSLGAKRD